MTQHQEHPAPDSAAPQDEVSTAGQPQQPQEAAAAAEAVQPEPAIAVDARVAELEAEVAKLKNEVLYARADLENTRRRLEQAAEDRGRYAVTGFAGDMLQVADNLRRALEAVPAEQREADEMVKTLFEGVELTERTLLSTLERHGVKKVEAQGQRFDPNLHQAMMEVEDTTQPSGTVVLVMQTGYTIHDRLLRPAMVGVSKGGPKAQPGEGVDTSA